VIGSRTKDTVEALSSIRTEIVMMDIGLMEILKERAELFTITKVYTRDSGMKVNATGTEF
jgi:hypothetical protein